MKTTLLVMASLAFATAFFATGVSATTDYCNGVYEDDGCTCRSGTNFCRAGDQCAFYAANTCIEGTILHLEQ